MARERLDAPGTGGRTRHADRRTRGTRQRRPLPLRALALVMALVIALTNALVPALGGASAAETEDGDRVYLTVGRWIYYGGSGTMGTSRMSVNGEVAYCSDPENDSPTSGYYTREPVHPRASGGSSRPVASVERTMFYSYGGPGFDADFWHDCIGGTDGKGRHFAAGKDWDGSSITTDEFYAYAHVLLAERMCNSASDALHKTSTDFKEWFYWNILGRTYGGGATNPNAVGPQIEKMSVPDGFEVYQLDTGYNSKWHEGDRSQIVVTFEYNPYVKVSFTKVSADATLTSGNDEYAYAGASYDIFEKDGGRKVVSITTDDRGHASCELKPNTSYYAVETTAPRGFVKGTGRVDFKTGSGAGSVSLSDEPGTLELVVAKTDSATGGAAQPGASLAGAEYKVVDANGDTHTGTTDEAGRVSFAGLPLGTVTVTETKAPEGYRLDPTPHEYHVGADELPEAGVVTLSPADDFAEDVIAFDLDLVKYSDTGAEGSGLQDPAVGVEFQVISNTTGDVVATLTTDEKGFATTEGGWYGEGERPEGVNGALPYDACGYTVREVASTAPDDHLPADDWSVTPEQMVDGVTLHYIVDNAFAKTRIQVVKTGARSGQAVPLAGFTFQLLDAEKNPVSQDLWYPNHEVISEFTTDESGRVTFPGELRPGTYYIRELAAVSPYLVAAEDVAFTVESSPAPAPVSVVTFSDDQATGSATIAKRCATGVWESSDEVLDGGCDDALAGAEFDVISLGDLTSPDGTVQAVTGEVVGHVTTGADGTATIEGLPLGTGTATYAFVETDPAPGHALDATPHEFTVSYADDHTAVVTASADASNEPTTVRLDKTVLGTGEPLAGVTFALWREDDGDEAERVPLTTGEDGSITMRHLLPGTYHLAEVETPDGYLSSGETITFVVDERGLVEGSASHAIAVENDRTKVELSKRDITTEEELPGARLTLLDADGEVVERWISTDEPHLIEALPTGAYTLVEEMTPHTYDEATAVEFFVEETGEVQHVVMYDEPIRVSGQLDKRQEIADPTRPGTEAGATTDEGGANRAEVSVSDDGSYEYSADVRSTSTTWVDEFTVTDELEAAQDGLARLTGIVTPVAGEDYDGLLNVWYRTDLTPADHVDGSGANATLSDGHENPWLRSEETAETLGDDGRVLSYEGWRLWAEGVSATEATELSVSGLDLAEGERVVAVRLEYGRVEAGFSTRSGDWDRDDLKDPHDDVDDVAHAHEGDVLAGAGEGAMRSPLVVRMRVTDAYGAGTRLTNHARVDLFRNGGRSDELEAHDSDRVEQEPVETVVPLPRTADAAAPALGVAAFGVVALLLGMRRRPRR